MNIANARNYGNHNSSAQKSIWHSIMMLAPLKSVIIDNQRFDKDSYETGAYEFYQFMKTLYNDMYCNPDKYFVPTKPYDEYISNCIINDTFHKEHHTDPKECKLRNTFQQAIQFYPEVIYKLGNEASDIYNKDFAFVISKSKYNGVMKSFNRSHVYEDNVNRIKAILDLGLEINEDNNMYLISSKKYPKMFLGLWILCSAPDSKYKYMNYLRLDYEGYFKPMPNIDDVILTMTNEHAQCVNLIQKSFQWQKVKYKVKPLRNITSSHEWKVEYTLNGKSFFGFYAEPDHLTLCIYFNNAKNITELSMKLENINTNIFNWFCSKFPERLCKCPNNRIVAFGDEKRRICGLSNRAEIVNPNDNDIENCFFIMKMFHGS